MKVVTSTMPSQGPQLRSDRLSLTSNINYPIQKDSVLQVKYDTSKQGVILRDTNNDLFNHMEMSLLPKTNAFDVKKQYKTKTTVSNTKKHKKYMTEEETDYELFAKLGLDSLEYPDLTQCNSEILAIAYCANTECYNNYEDVIRVTLTIVNRLHAPIFKKKHYKNYYDVVYDYKQFSAAPYYKKDGTRNKPGKLWRLGNNAHGRMMYKIAYLAYHNLMPEEYKINTNIVAFFDPKRSDKDFVAYMNKHAKLEFVSENGIHHYYSFLE